MTTQDCSAGRLRAVDGGLPEPQRSGAHGWPRGLQLLPWLSISLETSSEYPSKVLPLDIAVRRI